MMAKSSDDPQSAAADRASSNATVSQDSATKKKKTTTDSSAALARAKTPVEARVAQIAELLQSLDHEAQGKMAPQLEERQRRENQLIQVRLGLANGLFAALRWKHSPTASHSFRVAVTCTSWAIQRELADDQREWLEVAALLHDVGKIGVPDEVLVKPGKLLPEEAATLGRYREIGLEILKNCCATDEVLDIIRYAPAWFDGALPEFDRGGSELPLGARMISIADAFDAMTTDHVYRPARSRERAFAELFDFAGSQFDPELVTEFVQLHQNNLIGDLDFMERHWLGSLSGATSYTSWRRPENQQAQADETQAPGYSVERYQQQLVENMHDGVAFIDAQLRIFGWNVGAERLTGVSRSAMEQRPWSPSLLILRDEEGRLLPDEKCPVARAIKSGSQTIQRVSLSSRDRNEIPVDLHAIPVYDEEGTVRGVTMLLRDAESETSLAQRCQNLHTLATRDPLTQVANRAEFDRVLEEFVTQHLEANASCSLVICDIDRFKRVNDHYGHQAGDAAIISFSSLLKQGSRSGDLVARYGGEEFVVLCANCNNAAAAERAEGLRLELARTPQTALGGRAITASFGVTELQPGDTPQTMLRRADRALLLAKDRGRNQVVQLGTGRNESETSSSDHPDRYADSEKLVERQMVSNVPLNVSIEKLRGFVADHSAKIIAISDDRVELAINSHARTKSRRRNDRAIVFQMLLRFSEQREPEGNAKTQSASRAGSLQTIVHVAIRPSRGRDRRNRHLVEQAGDLMTSLQSYLMVKEVKR